jgi:hypothetical protein
MSFVKRLTLIGLVIMLSTLASACAIPAAPQNPLTPLPYTDDFSNPQGGWEQLSDLSADVRYDNGALQITVKQENLTQWSVASKRFKDATYEVDAKPVGGPTDNGFGVMFRVKDRKNFYHFEISSDGYWRAGIVQDGKWTNWDDWIQHPSIKTGGESNRIKVVMKAEKLTFYVNDQEVASREDKTILEGDIGVLALTVIDAPGTDIAFDNVSVTEAK